MNFRLYVCMHKLVLNRCDIFIAPFKWNFSVKLFTPFIFFVIFELFSVTLNVFMPQNNDYSTLQVIRKCFDCFLASS